MTSLRLGPPASFDFTHPDEWPRWKRRFQQFQVASGLALESEERQVSTLLYCMGEAAEDTLSSTGISSEGKKKFKTVMEKFDTFSRSEEMSILSAFVLIIAAKDRTNLLNSSSLVYIH